ncbi:hypothetical protein EON81_11160 [bacterium]|nr:MAG: hypothetical protein EON81_11160 [bacterium]
MTGLLFVLSLAATAPGLGSRVDLLEVARAIQTTRARIRTLSYSFYRLNEASAGAGSRGFFAMDSGGNRRYESSTNGERILTLVLKGDATRYEYASKLRSVTLHARPANGFNTGLLDACYEIRGEKLDSLVAKGTLVEERDDGTLLLESVLKDGGSAKLTLDRSLGFLCTRWEADGPKDLHVECRTERWERVAGVQLPSLVNWRSSSLSEAVRRTWSDEYESIRVNVPAAKWFVLPKIPAGVPILDGRAKRE